MIKKREIKQKIASTDVDLFDIDRLITSIASKRFTKSDQVNKIPNTKTTVSQISSNPIQSSQPDPSINSPINFKIGSSLDLSTDNPTNASNNSSDGQKTSNDITSNAQINKLKELIKEAIIRGASVNSILKQIQKLGLSKKETQSIFNDVYSDTNKKQILKNQVKIEQKIQNELKESQKIQEPKEDIETTNNNQNGDEKMSPENQEIQDPNPPTDNKAEGFDRDSDKFSPDDFAAMEADEDEKSKGLLGKIFAQKDNEEDQGGPETPIQVERDVFEGSYLDRATKAEIREITNRIMGDHKKRIDDIQLMVEKVDGKLAREKEVDEGINMRIADLVEKIGELRSTIMARERFFDKMETEFDSMKDIIHDFKPEVIKKEFQNKEKSILDLDAKMEKSNNLITNVAVELKQYRDVMTKIVSYENLLQTLEELNTRIKKIHETEKYIEKIGGKLETSYGDLNKKLGRIVHQDEELHNLKEISKEITKNVDGINSQISEKLDKHDLNKVYPEIENKFTKKFEKLNQEIAILKDALFAKEAEGSSMVHPLAGSTTTTTIATPIAKPISPPTQINQATTSSPQTPPAITPPQEHTQSIPTQNVAPKAIAQPNQTPQYEKPAPSEQTITSKTTINDVNKIKLEDKMSMMDSKINAGDKDAANALFYELRTTLENYTEDETIKSLKLRLTNIRTKLLSGTQEKVNFNWGNWQK